VSIWRWILALLTGVMTLPSSGAATVTMTVAAGEKVFWDGPFIEQASSGGTCEVGSCWTYKLRLTDPGYRLRVGLDHPEVGDAFAVDVFAPSGVRQATLNTGTGLYSVEYMRRDPMQGVWRIQVRADDVTDSSFRMRAKLEAHRPRLGTDGPVLPNLQVLPPHDASFLTPLTDGSQGDPPRGIEGPDSCHPEEREEGADRCLRFSFGLRNTGRGPLQLFFRGSEPDDHPLFQRVQRADGTHVDREAGIARWHETHDHYHHHDAVELQLFRVTDRRKGTLEPSGERHRKGFAHRDELLREWNHFYPSWNRFGFGLSAGWSDIYEWDRPGNYVEFGDNGDGFYVVRMWADPAHGILESNEKDNVGYSYMRVTGKTVEPIEAGRGKSPWDPCKIEVGFGGHPDPPQEKRPGRCPPDTS
jgi:Lysyl oxidase